MKYHVKWVEDNLGVSRKALRLYEEKGLMPANKNGKYREYDEQDLDRIWAIKTMQGMGYSLSEIYESIQRGEGNIFNFQDSISKKVEELEKKKAEAERLLGYAKMIQLTGRFPERPTERGKITFSDFYEKALNTWNVQNDPRLESVYRGTELYVGNDTGEYDESKLKELLEMLLDLGVNQKKIEEMLPITIFEKAIIARINQGVESAEVQLLVKLLYEHLNNLEGVMTHSPQIFCQWYSSIIMEGQIGQLSQLKYSQEECRFLADAIAVFGGYKNYDEII